MICWLSPATYRRRHRSSATIKHDREREYHGRLLRLNCCGYAITGCVCTGNEERQGERTASRRLPSGRRRSRLRHRDSSTLLCPSYLSSLRGSRSFVRRHPVEESDEYTMCSHSSVPRDFGHKKRPHVESMFTQVSEDRESETGYFRLSNLQHPACIVTAPRGMTTTMVSGDGTRYLFIEASWCTGRLGLVNNRCSTIGFSW